MQALKWVWYILLAMAVLGLFVGAGIILSFLVAAASVIGIVLFIAAAIKAANEQEVEPED